ncbi:MAG: PilZ domain-containing protein [Arenimonas sp.]
MNMDDQRRAVRYSYQCQVIVATVNNSCITQLENLSQTGCCIQKPADWNFSPNDVLNLYFVMDNENVMDAEAMLVWDSDKLIGLQYLQAQTIPIQIVDEMQ